MQPALAWTYAPRPGALPVGSACTPPSERRTRRIRSALPASSLQATQVLVGPRRSTPCPGPTRPSADLPRNGEELRAFANRLFGLAWFDVDPIAGQLRGEAGVLTVAADGEGQLSSRHQHRGGAGDAGDRHPLDLFGAERRRHENLRVLRPRDQGPPRVGRPGPNPS